MAVIDSRELKLRVQGSFSTGELRSLLERWGADSSRLPEDRVALAQELVRMGERTLGAAELVRRLRTEKPLVEWPEVSDDDSTWAEPAPTLSDLGPSEAHDPPVHAEPPPTTHEAPPPSRKHADNPMIFRAPGEATAPPKVGVDPKLLLGVGGLMVVLAGIAFAAGMVWRRSPVPAASAAVPAAAVPREKGPAGRAADSLDRGLVAVAGLCDLDVTGVPSREVFVIAQEGCGTAETERMRREQRAQRELGREPRKSPLDEPEPEPTSDAADDPPPTNAKRSGGGAPKTPGGACNASCASAHASCLGDCGAEPGDATQYDKYLGCTTRCVTQNSRCRLACP